MLCNLSEAPGWCHVSVRLNPFPTDFEGSLIILGCPLLGGCSASFTVTIRKADDAGMGLNTW